MSRIFPVSENDLVFENDPLCPSLLFRSSWRSLALLVRLDCFKYFGIVAAIPCSFEMMQLAQDLIADVSMPQCTGLLVLEQVTGFVGVLVHFSAASGALANYEIILVVRGGTVRQGHE